MPNKNEHLEHAEKFKLAYQHLLNSATPHPECVATLVFYRALHFVEALLSVDNAITKHCGGHQERENVLKDTNRYEAIWRHYLPLKIASMQARYLIDGNIFSRTYVGDAVERILIGHHLHQVESVVRRRIRRLEGSTP